MSDPTAATGNMVLERDFTASPEEIYRAFTDPDRLAQWFGPLGFHVPRSTVRVDARPGGFWRLVMVNNENRAITSPVDSVFTEVIPNERLVGYEDTRGMPGVPDGTRLVLTIEFQRVGAGTRLTIEQGPFPRSLSEMGAVGWRQSFHKLDALLETPAPMRASTAA
jgi:uncharacterized protein YndB with AHSA1/START domain